MSIFDSFTKQWSTTPNSNGITPNVVPYGWPEGQAPSSVNNCARQMMTDLRYLFEDMEWFNHGDTVSRASGATFKIATDVTARFMPDLRLKFNDSSVLYGTVVSSSYSAPDTTITVEMDTGSLTASLSAVALAILKPTNSSIPQSINPVGNNLLLNGDFVIAQRDTTFTSTSSPANTDAAYLLDRWALLSDGNDILDVSQETSVVPTGSYSAIKLDVETANKKAGILQIIEARDAKKIIGGYASLSFKARVGTNATVDIIRAAIISWSGTADATIVDVVSAWNSEGTSPTLVGNWTYENTPSSLTLTTTYQKFAIQNISIDTASTTNVAVFIWIENGDATVGDLVYITDVKLEYGSASTNFLSRPVSEELLLCQRYAVTYRVNNITDLCNGTFTSTTRVNGVVTLPVQMRVAPTGGTYQTIALVGGESNFKIVSAAGTVDCNAVAAGGASRDTFEIAFDTASAATAGFGAFTRLSSTAKILVEAELGA